MIDRPAPGAAPHHAQRLSRACCVQRACVITHGVQCRLEMGAPPDARRTARAAAGGGRERARVRAAGPHAAAGGAGHHGADGRARGRRHRPTKRHVRARLCLSLSQYVCMRYKRGVHTSLEGRSRPRRCLQNQGACVWGERVALVHLVHLVHRPLVVCLAASASPPARSAERLLSFRVASTTSVTGLRRAPRGRRSALIAPRMRPRWHPP